MGGCSGLNLRGYRGFGCCVDRLVGGRCKTNGTARSTERTIHQYHSMRVSDTPPASHTPPTHHPDKDHVREALPL
jgi:hypothetical protein